MSSAFACHPIKGIYSAAFFAFLQLRLLLSLIYYLPRKPQATSRMVDTAVGWDIRFESALLNVDKDRIPSEAWI